MCFSVSVSLQCPGGAEVVSAGHERLQTHGQNAGALSSAHTSEVGGREGGREGRGGREKSRGRGEGERKE